MQPGIPPIPLGRRAAAAFLILAIVAGGYPLYVEISRRKKAEAAVIEPWTRACATKHDPRSCEETVDELRDRCLRKARDIVRDEVVFDALPFFECMNARNERGLVLELPDSDAR